MSFRYGEASEKALVSCHTDIVRVFRRVIEVFDVKLTDGHRAPERQYELWLQGRDPATGEIVDSRKIVTNVDGRRRKGYHNYDPSLAIDAHPWPIDFENERRYHFMAGVVLALAHDEGVPLEWGGHWKGRLVDLPHFQLPLLYAEERRA
jgi:peptidoglycan LD-endopeptidase CwlK